jgi:hypothetical protein
VKPHARTCRRRGGLFRPPPTTVDARRGLGVSPSVCGSRALTAWVFERRTRDRPRRSAAGRRRSVWRAPWSRNVRSVHIHTLKYL